MKIIDRYIIRNTLSRFAILLGLVLFALLMERLVRLLDLVATKNTPFQVVAEIMVNLIPHYLGYALSTAFFIAALMAIIRLREDSELEALYAGGISLYRIAQPVLGLACVFCFVSVIVLGVLQPHARYGYKNLMHLAGYGSWYNILESGSFLTGIEDYTMTVGSISASGLALTDVFFHERTEMGEMTTTTAERGEFTIDNEGKLVLTLDNATQVNNGRADREPVVAKVKTFSKRIDTLFTPPPFRPRGNDERELTLIELWQQQITPPKGATVDEMKAELHSRVVRIFSILVLPFLAVGLGALSPKRRQGLSLTLGLFLLIAYNEVLQFGESMTEDGSVSPWLGQELPMLVFACLSFLIFLRASGSSWNGAAKLVDWCADKARFQRPANES
ncbi:MAG: LptF/LptG family permease [Geminicoccaceae bacterium]